MGLLQAPPAASRVVYLADHRVPSHRRHAAQARQQPASAPSNWARMAQARAALRLLATPAQQDCAPLPARPASVRVTHFAQAANNVSGRAPRLRICGRLADVCAELERMAAAETHQAAMPRRA